MRAVRQLSAVILATLALCASASAAVPALAETDQQCLACHGQPGLEKTLGNGSTVPLLVEGDAFARSAHAPLGCAACHADVDVKKHPGTSRKAVSMRALSIALGESCAGCHQEIVQAHEKSKHGQARDKVATLSAPLCADCHRVHELGRVVAGVHPRDACLTCHAAAATHEVWLPNARKHLEVVACSACHAPGAQRRVDLRLQDPVTKGEFIATGLKARKESLDAATLRDFMNDINAGGNGRKVVLVGRLEARDMVAAHGLAAKGEAVKDCATCHRKGADAFQKVSLSVLGPDGKRVSYEAQKEVLNSPTSVDSVRGFYAMGGTRIQALDVLLGLALVGGISAPLGHMVMRRLARRKEGGK
jgi:cytochrome c3-like protein